MVSVAVGDGLSDAEFAGYQSPRAEVGGEKAEFALFVFRTDGSIRIFDYRCDGRIGEYESAFASPFELVCENAKGVGVAFEVCEVSPLAVAEFLSVLLIRDSPILIPPPSQFASSYS